MTSTACETLTLKRDFDVSVEQLYQAWTRTEVLSQWFGPEGFKVMQSSIDLRPYGLYHITIESPEGTQIHHYGQYLEIQANQKLVFTWSLDNQPCQGGHNAKTETLVTIDFISLGEHSRIILTHEKLPDKQSLDGHRFGWNSSLDSLERYLSH